MKTLDNTPEQRHIHIPIPASLQLKDLIMIVSTAITLTLAWGVFGTRLTVLERELVTMQASNDAQRAAIDKLYDKCERNATHQQDDELIIDQIFQLLRRPPPTRRATN